MNCEGYFQLNYRNTATASSALKRLTTQKINVLTFTSGKTVTTINLTVEQKEKFQKMATCIANEAPSLLKP
jgi:TATA-box binding protein (TBP) (component of TFIID and TFIIIB)